MIRVAKNILKSTIRQAVRWRVCCFPLSTSQAEWWGKTIRSYPAIFTETSITKLAQLPHQLQMSVGLVDHIERQLWLHKVWDEPVKMVLESLLKPGDVYLDLGANIGYFTLMASRLVGADGLVVAAEPSIRALRKLTFHLWQNQCLNVLLLSGAVGDQWAMSQLSLAVDTNIGGSAVRFNESAGQSFESIWILPIDAFLQSSERKPNLIKLDLEGFELRALRGAKRTIEQARPWIICEVTERFLRRFDGSTEELFLFLEEYGYQPYSCQIINHQVDWAKTSWQACAAATQIDVLFVPPGQSIQAVMN